MSKTRIPLRRAILNFLHNNGFQRVSKELLQTLELQKKLINNDKPVIFDVGAHSGGLTKLYLEIFPRAIIHCFEPFEDSFNGLKNRFSEDSRIFCHKIAFAEQNGKAVFNSNRSSGTNSLLETDERAKNYWGSGMLDTVKQMEIETISVDDFCLEKKLEKIDILKLDIQGAELSVLKGAKRLLREKKIGLVYTEIIFCPTYKGQNKLYEYLAYMDSFGYEFLDFYNQIRKKKQLVQADVIFISQELKAQALKQY